MARELTRLELLPDLGAESFRKQLQPQQLDITFDTTQSEFVDPTKVTDERGVTWPCKLYRVAVISHSSSPATRDTLPTASVHF